MQSTKGFCEPCVVMEDTKLIYAKNLIEEIEWLKSQSGPTNHAMYDEWIERVRNQPRVNARPLIMGNWIRVKDHWECSACRGSRFHDLALGMDAAYCGRCGAFMTETEEKLNGKTDENLWR